MNTNLIHNILNVLIAMAGVVSALLIATGCTSMASGELDCTRSVIDPAYTAMAVAMMGGLKTVINITRDGVSGLIRPQPPVDRPTDR